MTDGLFNDRRTPSQRTMQDPEFRALHQLGDCVDCGRTEDHKWHKLGEAFIGDGQQPHRYNPEGAKFQRLTPES